MPVAKTSLSMPSASIALRDSGGTGLPILLLHGIGASAEVFRHQFDSPLADLFRLVAFDLPGHGKSSDAIDPERAYTLPSLADTAADVLRQLHVERALVFGWSLGGHIAMELLHRHPTLVAGAILTGAPPIAHGPLASLRAFHINLQVLQATRDIGSRRDAERLERFCFDTAADGSFVATIMRSDGRLRAGVARSMRQNDFADEKRLVATTTTPIAMVNGEHEPAARLSYVEGLDYASLWEDRGHIIAGAGHAPFLTHSNAFNAVLHRFASDIALRERTATTTPQRQTGNRA